MHESIRYDGKYVLVKGRMTNGPTTFADVGASTGVIVHGSLAIEGR